MGCNALPGRIVFKIGLQEIETVAVGEFGLSVK